MSTLRELLDELAEQPGSPDEEMLFAHPVPIPMNKSYRSGGSEHVQW